MKFKINEDIEDMNLQVILMNTQTITASKFQEMVEACLKCKDHSSIFCFTETKCDSLNFKLVGLKIFTKHRMNMTVLSTEPYNCNKLNDMNVDTSNKNKISVINLK